MSRPKIVAFGHRSRMGKDASAKFLMTALRMTCPHISIRRMAFAEELKICAHRLWKNHGLQSGEYYDSHENERNVVIQAIGKTPVDLWIELGMSVRGIYNNTWVDVVLLEPKSDLIVITDLRFHNEASRIHDLGGLCIKVHNPRTPLRDSPADKELDNYDKWDAVIENNDSLAHLNNKVLALIKDFGINGQ